ncbi:hypothetical protein H8E07_13110 [bacterium]|nr:hypothetical protein [bacterium]
MQCCSRLPRILTLAILAGALLLPAPPASAATLFTDALVYERGDVVTITLYNDGDASISTLTAPPLGITHVSSGTAVRWPGGLPDATYLEPGESLVFTHDTGLGPDPLGLYRAWIEYFADGGTHMAETEYTLASGMPAWTSSWGELKRLYRD